VLSYGSDLREQKNLYFSKTFKPVQCSKHVAQIPMVNFAHGSAPVTGLMLDSKNTILQEDPRHQPWLVYFANCALVGVRGR
jgi:hypothetical protein